MEGKENQSTTTRRNFIKTAAISSAGFMILPRCTLGGKGFVAPSDKINIALVGAGGISIHHLNEVFKYDDVQIISIADPAEYWASQSSNNNESGRMPRKKLIEDHYSQKFPNYRITEYEDFRRMLEKDPAIDAVICCTPDNTHAYISINSMKAGKHVYCQKPLTHNIWEAQKVNDVAFETGLATQMGNQLHALDTMRETVEVLRSAVIGPIHQAYSWVGASRYLKGISGNPTESMKVPKGFNWDLWVGPSTFRPYHSNYTPFTWRDFWEFGNGALGDFGCHDMDAITWALDLDLPKSVQVFPAGNRGSSEVTPFGEIGHYYFDSNGNRPPLKLTWLSGGLLPEHPEVLPQNIKLKSRGAMYIGEKGVILTNGGAMFIAGMSDILEPPVNDIWIVPDEEQFLEQWKKEDSEIFQSVDPIVYYMQKQIEDYLHALDNNTDPLVTGEEGRKTVELFTAIYRSTRDNKPIKFPLSPEKERYDMDGRFKH